ncbi:hypothetical protein CASFOL_016988 [Castilleja foliolosa]|uniref:Uncharacterized protein n=1 Tax=Castilleja foliolosa TaxID=1961234 RepID=A0ABD3D9S7_9LAMI
MGRKRRGHWVFEDDSESEFECEEEIKESEEKVDEECDYDSSDKRVMVHGMMKDEEFDVELGEDVTIKLGAPFKVYEAEAKLYESLKARDVIRPVNIFYKFWQPGAKDEKVPFTYLRLIEHLLRTPMRPKGKRVQVCCLQRRDEDVDADIKYYIKNAPSMLKYVENYTPPPELRIEEPRQPRQKTVTCSQLKKMMELLERDDPPPPKN